MHVPMEIATADPRLIRPRDLSDRYADAGKEVLRLAASGLLLRVAHGYYAVVPERNRGTRWRPSIEAVALAIGQADYSFDEVAVMGVSAARLLGAIPRALGAAVVAVPKQRPALDTEFGTVRFVTRDVAGLNVQRTKTELATGWVTTAEQTVLDLCDRPELGDQDRQDVAAAVRHLTSRDFDWQRIAGLAVRQRKSPAAVRAARIADVAPPVDARRPVDSAGLPGADASPGA